LCKQRLLFGGKQVALELRADQLLNLSPVKLFLSSFPIPLLSKRLDTEA
jgi:hypothetical protein